MLRSWFVGGLLVLAVSILLPVPPGYTDTEVFPVCLPNAAEASTVCEVAVGLAEREAPVRVLPVRSATPAAIQVADPSRSLTLETLRWELAAERLPLSGEDD